MIASVQSIYDGTKDMVEASVHILEDDATSLHRYIDTASLKLLFNRTIMQTMSFDARAYCPEWQKFFLFFLHPPVQNYLSVRLDVSLIDGRTASETSPVHLQKLLGDPSQLQNPALTGRASTDYTGTPGFELITKPTS